MTMIDTTVSKDGQMAKPPRRRSKSGSDLWRRPVDLTPEMAARLLHGLAAHHERRLELFATKGPRVRMSELLAVTGDEDLRALSYFQGALSRKLRRLLGDRDRKVHLIGWDYDSTVWDDEQSQIVDGVCYVTEATARSLAHHFGHDGG